MLKNLFGNNTLIRVLDFLLENRFWDYTKTDIARHSGISRTQLYRTWSNVLEKGLVKETRKIGATVLYQTNMESPIMKHLEKLSLTIAEGSVNSSGLLRFSE
jgi:Fe2+ or Zn2+ uptake regulation protein